MTVEFVVLDRAGRPQSWRWAQQTFGVRLRHAPAKTGRVFRLVRLVETEGMQIRVRALDREGNGLQGMPVVRSWPTAPALEPFDPPASNWLGRGIFGRTDLRGEVFLQLGAGEIAPAGQGAGALWIASELGPSDLLERMAPLPGGRRHLDPVWTLLEASEVVQIAGDMEHPTESGAETKTPAAEALPVPAAAKPMPQPPEPELHASRRSDAFADLAARVAALEVTLAGLPNVDQWHRLDELDSLMQRITALEGTLARAETVQQAVNRLANLTLRVAELEAHDERLATALDALLKAWQS